MVDAGLDGDNERTRLEEERDHLLRSIGDLDRELEAGDIDEADHAALKDDYTIRAAEVIGALDEHSSGREQRSDSSDSRRWKSVLVVVGVVGFAVVSGIVVASNAGQRGSNAITGSSGSIREQLATCQPLSFQEPAKGVECYDDILNKAPDNLEALTYQGWAMVRAGDVERGGSNFARVIDIDPAYPDVRVFRAIVASRAGDFTKASEELAIFYANDPSPMSVQVLQSQGLERDIFFGLLAEPIRECWQKAAAASGDNKQLDEPFYRELGECLDPVIDSDAPSADAFTSRAFAAAGLASEEGKSTSDAAAPFLSRALESDPANPNALLLRAALDAVNGNTDTAKADLDRLADLGRPTMSFLVGSPDQIRESLG